MARPGSRRQLQIGTHTRWVPFRLELHDTEPMLDPAWEEIVEVSLTALSIERPSEKSAPPG
ncbi:hypothetical protein GCM10010172_73570 [Paractinoplanes ferrugineus]|uniref:Uncharacterized protein n=1 Tax=Paractinoplanes ferrugineus TaxID=113564 RepID=A0A919J212_9ACTN|nr:hypothetical protein Afe05nite_33280 [Actinoplanes ferrugineus]